MTRAVKWELHLQLLVFIFFQSERFIARIPPMNHFFLSFGRILWKHLWISKPVSVANTFHLNVCLCVCVNQWMHRPTIPCSCLASVCCACGEALIFQPTTQLPTEPFRFKTTSSLLLFAFSLLFIHLDSNWSLLLLYCNLHYLWDIIMQSYLQYNGAHIKYTLLWAHGESRRSINEWLMVESSPSSSLLIATLWFIILFTAFPVFRPFIPLPTSNSFMLLLPPFAAACHMAGSPACVPVQCALKCGETRIINTLLIILVSVVLSCSSVTSLHRTFISTLLW